VSQPVAMSAFDLALQLLLWEMSESIGLASFSIQGLSPWRVNAVEDYEDAFAKKLARADVHAVFVHATSLTHRMRPELLAIVCQACSARGRRLRAVSKRTFSSDNRMAVQTFLGAIFNQVSRWQVEDRLEEELYRLLDSLKAPVPLKIGEAFAVVIYCTAPHVDQKSRRGSSVAVCSR
jgi:hypothetical protein